MSKVLRVDPSAADAWVEKDLGTPIADFWITADIFFPAATLAQFLLYASQWIFNTMLPDDTQADAVGVEGGGPSAHWVPLGTTGSSPIPADAWLTCEFHHLTNTGGLGEFIVGGVHLIGTFDITGTDSQKVLIGLLGSGMLTPSVFYIRNVKFGTTQGASDLGADDFSSGDLTFWTTTSGDVTVIDDPTTGGSTAPDPPILTAATPGDTTVDLAWTPGSDGGSAITSYDVYRGTSSGTETLLTSLGVVTSFHDTGLTNGDAYFYKVVAINAIGESALSNELSATPAAVPDAPTLDSLTPGVGMIDLAWTPGGDGGSSITEYRVYRSIVTAVETLHASPGLVTALTDPATPGITYFYEVTAVNAVGESARSNELSAAPDAITPSFELPVLTMKLYDLGTTELADISAICLERTLKRRLNQTRIFTFTAPAGSSLLTDLYETDSLPNLRKGNRKLVVWEDDLVIFHGRIFTIERTGDGTQNLVKVTAMEPLMELGYDSEDRAGRPVRGSTTQPTAGDPYGEYDGNFISPLFASSVADQDGISGPDLILQALTNSLNTGAESDPSPGEGPLPIDLTSGTFDLDVLPAIDLSPSDSMTWPVQCGDFIQQLVLTGVVDVDLVPLDPADATDPYFMGILNAVSVQGSDKSGTVHFDYWTGLKNASQARHVEDFATINNKLYDYLGPRKDRRHWRASITPDALGVTVDPDSSRALYGGPPGAETPGEFMSIRIYDSLGDEAASRPLYLALYNGELGFRVEPRDMLFITPASGPAGLFTAPQDFDVGDLIAVNTGGDFGITLAENQRVYGWDKTWGRDGIPRLSEIITSADAE